MRMSVILCWAAVVLVVTTSCRNGGGGSGPDGDTDAEMDLDADIEADAEEDASSDADTESDGYGDADAEEVGPECGNFRCEEGETCEECHVDCGECPECELAPGCTGAPSVPTDSVRLEAFDNDGQSSYTSGIGLGLPASETDCLDARLRIRLREFQVAMNGRSIGNIDMYCVIVASDGTSSEIFITPRWAGIGDEHIPLHVDPLSASFWGQVELTTTYSNLAITYQCLESTDNSEYEAMLDTVAEVAMEAGGIAGPYGWAFGLGSIGASVLADVVGSSSDVIRLSVQQIIDEDALLDLTNGRIWQIRQQSDTEDLFQDWEGMLEVEAWGCSEPRPTAD